MRWFNIYVHISIYKKTNYNLLWPGALYRANLSENWGSCSSGGRGKGVFWVREGGGGTDIQAQLFIYIGATLNRRYVYPTFNLLLAGL